MLENRLSYFDCLCNNNTMSCLHMREDNPRALGKHGLSILNHQNQRGTKYHSERVIIGPPAKHHSNGVSLACSS